MTTCLDFAVSLFGGQAFASRPDVGVVGLCFDNTLTLSQTIRGDGFGSCFLKIAVCLGSVKYSALLLKAGSSQLRLRSSQRKGSTAERLPPISLVKERCCSVSRAHICKWETSHPRSHLIIAAGRQVSKLRPCCGKTFTATFPKLTFRVLFLHRRPHHGKIWQQACTDQGRNTTGEKRRKEKGEYQETPHGRIRSILRSQQPNGARPFQTRSGTRNDYRRAFGCAGELPH